MKNCLKFKMNNWRTLLLLVASLIAFSSCNPMGSEKFKVAFKNPSAFKDLKTQVSSVTVVNNQLMISGTSLKNIKSATLKNNSQEDGQQ